jgi:hypothetical protein
MSTTHSRTVEQVVVLLPTNLHHLHEVLRKLDQRHPDMPWQCVKITSNGDQLVIGVPVDWRTEDARTGATT